MMPDMKWGTKEWFENMCDPSYADDRGDQWGHRWRGVVKHRYSCCLEIMKPLFVRNGNHLDILDIGCAFGDFTEKVRKLETRNNIVGIDISENAIGIASKRIPGVRFQVDSLPELRFPPASFHIVLCLEVLYYLDPGGILQSLDSIRKTLKPKGYLLVSGTLNKGKRYFNRAEILANISDSGFDIKEVRFLYGRIYESIERFILRIRRHVVMLDEVLMMTGREYGQWRTGAGSGVRPGFAVFFRRVSCRIPGGKKSMNRCLRFIETALRYSVAGEKIVIFFNGVTKLLLGDRGITKIIIYAQNRDSG